MSKFVEFLKLMPEIWINKTEILEGCINYVKEHHGKLPEDVQEEIVRRRIICEACPLFSLNTFNNDSEYQKLYGKKFESSRTDAFCVCCGCKEQVKTASMASNCGLESYNEEFPNNKQPLKWTSYKPKEK